MDATIFVDFFCQRHGKHREGNLTDEGRNQVAQGAERHLRGKSFQFACASEMIRGTETVEHALATINHGPRSVLTSQYWGFEYSQDSPWDARHPWPEVLKLVQARRANDEVSSVQFMLEKWPIGNTIRHTLMCHMTHEAQRMAAAAQNNVVNVPVGCHGSNGLSALDLKQEGCLNFGDIVRYRWKVVDDGTPTLTESEYLPSGITDF